MKKAYITAKFYDRKNNIDFVKHFNNYDEFNRYLILNKQFVLLRVEYAD